MIVATSVFDLSRSVEYTLPSPETWFNSAFSISHPERRFKKSEKRIQQRKPSKEIPLSSKSPFVLIAQSYQDYNNEFKRSKNDKI